MIWRTDNALAEQSRAEQPYRLGNIYGFDGGSYAGNVYDYHFISPTINTCQGGNRMPLVVIKDAKHIHNR